MKSYRIVLDYTVTTGTPITPWDWDWNHLLDISPQEAVSIVSCAHIDTPEGHKEELDAPVL